MSAYYNTCYFDDSIALVHKLTCAGQVCTVKEKVNLIFVHSVTCCFDDNNIVLLTVIHVVLVH